MCFLWNIRLKLISIIVVALGVGVGCCRSNKLILELVMGTCVRSLQNYMLFVAFQFITHIS